MISYFLVLFAINPKFWRQCKGMCLNIPEEIDIKNIIIFSILISLFLSCLSNNFNSDIFYFILFLFNPTISIILFFFSSFLTCSLPTLPFLSPQTNKGLKSLCKNITCLLTPKWNSLNMLTCFFIIHQKKNAFSMSSRMFSQDYYS